MFQSTFPRGERLISHTGASRYLSFNPRSREGNDDILLLSDRGGQSFNPRSREGNDTMYGGNVMYQQGFNPRSREGNDTYCSVYVIL